MLENENFIKITFYELRVKYNLSENNINQLLHLARTKAYSTGNKYIYKNCNKVIKENDNDKKVKEKDNVEWKKNIKTINKYVLFYK